MSTVILNTEIFLQIHKQDVDVFLKVWKVSHLFVCEITKLFKSTHDNISALQENELLFIFNYSFPGF